MSEIKIGLEYVGFVDCWTDEERLTDEEIVRCRDCKEFAFGDVEFATADWCDYWDAFVESPDGFCAWGERKVDG